MSSEGDGLARFTERGVGVKVEHIFVTVAFSLAMIFRKHLNLQAVLAGCLPDEACHLLARSDLLLPPRHAAEIASNFLLAVVTPRHQHRHKNDTAHALFISPRR